MPTGIAIGFVITLIISICIGNGSFYPVTPELIDATGNELNAVILQTVLCAIMGAGFAASSIIWELDSWSLAKQSGIYFMIISVIMLPIAYFTNWMKHTALGVLSYMAIFVAIFVVVWLSQYLLWKRKIKQQLNRAQAPSARQGPALQKGAATENLREKNTMNKLVTAPTAPPQDGVSQADLERFARFLLPKIQAFYQSEAGQRLFEE